MAQLMISPFLRTPFTDLTGGLLSHQLFGRCAQMEMNLADCMEAYGYTRGLRKCRDILDDFKECHTMFKQFSRFHAMREERDKQIAEGKLTGDKKYVSPRVDSY